MAAAVSSVWAKPGAWALEAEEHEAELQKQAPPSSTTTTTTQISDSSAFPSLAAAATTKTKKKKPQAISLAEFTAKPTPQPERLTPAEIVHLPTGPRERTAEELERNKGFRSYGSERRDDSRWAQNREDGERRRERDSGPSRADENDNWAASKKVSVGGGNGYERSERRERSGGFFEGSQSSSKADEVDSWVSNKTPMEPRRFVSSNGGDRFEKRGSFESLSRNRDSDSDTWARRRGEESGGGEAGGLSGGGGSRPRLVLQKRTLPAPVVEVKQESVVVRPESPVLINVERPKGANPFGNARPREEVLAEKGQDWKEIEEKLEAVKMKEVAAVIEKADERSPGKMGFGFANGRTEGSWRKSTEPSEEGAQQKEPALEEANKEEDTKEEAIKEEATKEEATKEEATKEEAESKA